MVSKANLANKLLIGILFLSTKSLPDVAENKQLSGASE
jgi:hypothetical protein